MTKLLKLHHSAYRCRDSEETRKFYEEFLELKLVKVLEIKNTKTDRRTNALHTFYQLKDGSCIAFFEERLSSILKNKEILICILHLKFLSQIYKECLKKGIILKLRLEV